MLTISDIIFVVNKKIACIFFAILDRTVMILRGRPKKSSTVDHMTATRLTDKQWNYVRHRASAEDLSVGTVLRKIVEEHRQQDDKQ